MLQTSCVYTSNPFIDCLFALEIRIWCNMLKHSLQRQMLQTLSLSYRVCVGNFTIHTHKIKAGKDLSLRNLRFGFTMFLFCLAFFFVFFFARFAHILVHSIRLAFARMITRSRTFWCFFFICHFYCVYLAEYFMLFLFFFLLGCLRVCVISKSEGSGNWSPIFCVCACSLCFTVLCYVCV